jgi:hypothetical protein
MITLTSDPNDPEVIIKIDVSNAFNTTCRALKHGEAIPACENLSNLFAYFKAMRTCHTKLRYFDWDEQVQLVKVKTGGQQGDPLEMLMFKLTMHHLWGRVLAKFQAWAITYTDDGYINIHYRLLRFCLLCALEKGY